MKKILLAGFMTLLAACGTTPQSSPRPLEEPVISTPRISDGARQPTVSAPVSVLIQGRSNKAVLDTIQQNRTRRGMKLMSRNAYRIQFSQTLPGATPPIAPGGTPGVARPIDRAAISVARCAR